MKGSNREITKSSTDFLVCFPSRAHLALLSKPIRSPLRLQLPEPNNSRGGGRHQPPPPPPPQQGPPTRRGRLKKSGTARRGQASPVLWSKGKQMCSGPVISEPTSPKVTCAGQIKVKPKSGAGAGRSWQSVMEEIEKIHDGKSKKRPGSSVRGGESMLGFGKEIMQFLTCLRNVRVNFRCFGSFPEPEISSDDDDEENDDDGEDEEDDQECKYEESDEKSKAIFSKWFMVLQESKNFPAKIAETDQIENRDQSRRAESWDEGSFAAAVPPPNALLLMRCRSAPAKSWLEEQEEQEAMEKEIEEKVDQKGKKKNELKNLIDEEKKEEEEDRKKKQNMFFDGYDTEYYKISTDVAKETWVIGAMSDSLLKCRSSKS